MPSWWPAKASYTRAAEAKDETAAEYTCDEHLMSLTELASRCDTPATLCTAPPVSRPLVKGRHMRELRAASSSCATVG